jgi:hypothetical protein
MGDKLVCIKDDSFNYDDFSFGIAPDIGEIVEVCRVNSFGWLVLWGYDPGYCYDPRCFRKMRDQSLTPGEIRQKIREALVDI